MRSIVRCGGEFDPAAFCDDYVSFMTTPGSHNDTYASTAHRQFFENHVRGVEPMRCASNDHHNTDAIDALVLPAVVALATVGKPEAEAVRLAQACGEITRRSQTVQQHVAAMVVPLIRSVLGVGRDGGVRIADGAVGLDEATRAIAARHMRGLRLDDRGMDLVTA